MTEQPQPCEALEARQFDFWLGEWDLTWGEDGRGRNTITSRYGGCLIEENFDGAPAMDFKGMSVSTYRYRFLSTSLGRFIQPDPIIPDWTNSQSLNRYAYAFNSPVMYNDPSGHIPICISGECIHPGENTFTQGNGIQNYDQPGNLDEDLTSYPDFDPIPAPDWMPGFMAEDWLIAQNAAWIVGHPDATLGQKAFAGSVLGGYIVGYGGFLTGAAILGYAGAQAIINATALACIGSPTCATLTGLGGAACADGDCTNEIQKPLEIGNQVQSKFGGIVQTASNNKGIRITWPNAMPGERNLVLRLMESGGTNTNYWRLSIDGLGSYTLDGSISSLSELTHHAITSTTLMDILTLLEQVLP